jgi:hypothetical protein
MALGKSGRSSVRRDCVDRIDPCISAGDCHQGHTEHDGLRISVPQDGDIDRVRGIKADFVAGPPVPISATVTW